MDNVIKDLIGLDWANSGWRKEAADILSCRSDLSYDVAEYIRKLNDRVRLARFDGSHETSTHYKWLIYRDEDRRFALWLHCYKPSIQRGSGYAQVPHNHRYDLCSIVLSGGYTSIVYDVSDGVEEIDRASLRVGEILDLACDQVHSLDKIQDGTKSLFIEGPTMRNFSTAFSSGRERRDFVDFEGRYADLLADLDSNSRIAEAY